MVKIILNGEMHNSARAPGLALRDIEALSVGEKKFICASEDFHLVPERIGALIEELEAFLVDTDQTNEAKLELEKENKKLFDKIMLGDDGEVRFSKDEVKFLKALRDKYGFSEIDPMDFVDMLMQYESMMELRGGRERIDAMLKFSKKMPEFAVASIEDEEGMAEYYALKEKNDRNEISPEEMERLHFLALDPELEKRRVAAMAQKIFNLANDLPADGVVYVYPLGNHHVAGIHAALKARGADFEIHANCLWDSKEARAEILAAGVSVKDGEMIRDFFLSEERQGGYDDFFAATFPELKPSYSPLSPSHAAAAGAGIASGGAGR